MTHEMDIWHDSFVKIKEQTKTIEMRLFDEKRSLISTGDIHWQRAATLCRQHPVLACQHGMIGRC